MQNPHPATARRHRSRSPSRSRWRSPRAAAARRAARRRRLDQPGSSGSVTLRLGYFPNVTHAPAIIGAQSGSFAAKLGPNVKLELKTFNSGTEATTALLAGAIDASFVGPNPAINAYQKTERRDPHRRPAPRRAAPTSS